MSAPADTRSRSGLDEALTTALASLPPVGLAELDERAALRTRVDRKYVVPLAQVRALVETLAPVARVLEVDGRRAFDYESVYFDTPGLTCYTLAARRRPTRFKVRTRTYVDSGARFLEVKTRDRRGRTVKHRCPYEADPTTMTVDGRGFADSVLDAAGIRTDGPATLLPTLVTRYRRSTLLLTGEGSRLTIDTGLTCLEHAPPHRGPGRSRPAAGLVGSAVVETKTVGHAGAADRALWALGHRPLRLSKYASGLAALRPDLPATPWTPVLRRHLTSTWSPS